jgi:predicted RNA-binding Zn-ribbon protein involved in translation (DUF1610 family)
MDEKELYDLVCVKGRCPECNGETRQIEKETFSGREMREYQCQGCGWRHIFDLGPALWAILSDANNEADETPAPIQPAAPVPSRPALPPS